MSKLKLVVTMEAVVNNVMVSRISISTVLILTTLFCTTTLADWNTKQPPSSGGYNDFYRELNEQDYDVMLDDTPRGEVERLLKDYQQNQDFIRNLGNRFYQIIYPIQVRQRERFGVSTREIAYGKYGGPGRGMNDMNGMDPNQPRQQNQKHYRRTSLLIKAFQHKFRLDLELNTRLLAPNVRQREFLKEGAVSVSQQDIEHCYYHGSVKDFSGSEFIPGSMAALQTCNGVSGIVHLGNETFVIHPFYGGDLSSKHPHVLYEYKDNSPQGCAVTDNYSGGYERGKRTILEDLAKLVPTMDEEEAEEKVKRDVRTVKKFIEVALVLDKAMFDKRPHSSRKDVIHDAIQVANIADLYFKNSLNTRLSLVYVETWQDADQTPGFSRQRNIAEAMRTFSDYTGRKLYSVDKDTTQLLTGKTFDNGKSTISTKGTICGGKAVGISVDVNVFQPHILAANLAHAIGHNVGFSHDALDPTYGSSAMCSCPDWHGCLMRPSIIGEEGIQPYKFSTCSKQQFNQWMGEGHALCLLNKPNQIADFGSCGNGIVDDGEQCDCGGVDDCARNDPCCDPLTCRLKREADCSGGQCCDENCKLRPAGYQCRPASNECDLSELCSGTSGECPTDLYVKNLVDCNNGQGYCFNGQCPTVKGQCREVWGHKAEAADEACYIKFNVLGTQSGNCGAKKYAPGFKPCERENILCGTLHCQDGSVKPRIPQSTYSSHTQTIDGKDVQCRVMSGTVAIQEAQNSVTVDYGMVQDGTKCSDQKICMNQTCVSTSPLKSYMRCPVDTSNMECSGRGICSNINTCVCDLGFGGHDCSKLVPTFPPPFTNKPTGPTTPVPDAGLTPSNTYILKESDSDTIIMVIVLVAGVGGVFILFALMALCYRRKSALPKYDPPYTKRQMMKGYSHPNSPHPSQHLTPDHTFDDAGKLSQGLGGFPPYRPVDSMEFAPSMRGDHGMQHMKPIGTPGRGNIPGHGSNPMLADPGYGPSEMNGTWFTEKGGILKKPGPYGSMEVEKEKWLDENADRLSRMERLDRLSMSSQNQLNVQQPPTSAQADAMQSVNGYHESLLEALRNAAAAANSSQRGSNSSNSYGLGGGQPGQPGGGPPGAPGGAGGGGAGSNHRSSAASLTEDLRKTLADSYFEYGASLGLVPGPSGPMGPGAPSSAAVVAAAAAAAAAAAQKQQQQPGGGGRGGPVGSREKLDSEQSGSAAITQPIRIRNLEDLIRQLEHSSRHAMSPNGSDDMRDSSTAGPDPRHFSVSRTHSQGPEDPAFAMGQYPHQGTLNNKPQRRSSSGHPAGHPQPQTPRLNASGTATGGVGGPGPTPRRATTPGAGGVITPGSNFDASEVDSEDFLRSQLMRSASDEALGLKSDDLEDDVDSLRSPFYKPRSSHLRGYPLESPQSPHSEDSSYQGSIPGSGPSDRSYNGGGGGSNGSATAAGRQPAGGASGAGGGGGGGLGAGPDDLEAEAMTRAGYYLPDYKH